LAAEYGRHATDQLSIRVDDLSRIGEMMARVRHSPPVTLLGEPVTSTDLDPVADVVTFTWTGGRAVLRPSGTEPKLKAYLEVVTDESAEAAAEQLTRLRAEIAELLAT
jgi:phosphomannomutase